MIDMRARSPERRDSARIEAELVEERKTAVAASIWAPDNPLKLNVS
jgi:hypothetical protein